VGVLLDVGLTREGKMVWGGGASKEDSGGFKAMGSGGFQLGRDIEFATAPKVGREEAGEEAGNGGENALEGEADEGVGWL